MARLFAALCLLGAVWNGAALASDGAATWVNHLLRLWIPGQLALCGEPVPLERPDVLERLDLELVVVLGDPVSLTLWYKRGPRHLPIIEEALREMGLPRDLKYVALVESNLRPDAVSRAGAVGVWQFLRGTAGQYGLRCDGARDERRDCARATRAALEHLRDLRNDLGSWTLALAAYNAGRRRVLRAMEQQGETDFYGLRLPRETERYVFRVMAAKLLLEHPERYGIELEGARIYPAPATAEVLLNVDRRSMPVTALARAAGVSYRRFLELNPWIVGKALPRGRYRVLVPRAGASAFLERLAAWEREHPEPKKIFYRVKRGDTLIGIARRHGVRLTELCEWNGLTPRTTIYPGQTLVVMLTN